MLALLTVTAAGSLSAQTAPTQNAPATDAPPRLLLPLPEEEDWSFLANPNYRHERLDRLKYISLGNSGYLSLGGEGRFYLESIQNENFGQIPGFNTYQELRALLHADWHITPNIRFFAEIQSAEIYGRREGPRPSVDRDDLDLLEAFAEWRSTAFDRELRGPAFTVRIGRQQFDFGGGRLLSAREGPSGEGTNVLQGFDGIRLIGRHRNWRSDLFAAKPNEQKPRVFNDGWLAGQGAWGASLAREGPPGSTIPGTEFLYLGTSRPNTPYFAGVGHETRHSLSLRAFRANTPWSYDAEAIYQFGTFGGRNIRAWGTALETNYTFRNTAWSPQPGLRIGVDSGGFSRSTLGTFSVPFPRGAYFGNLSAIGPENTTGVEGAVSLHPTRALTLTGGAFVFWRKSLADGVYSLPGYPLLPPANTRRGIGVQPVSLATWKASPHWTLNAAYEHFRRGDFISSIPVTRSIHYVALWAVFRF